MKKSLIVFLLGLCSCTGQQPAPTPPNTTTAIQGDELILKVDSLYGAAVVSLVWNGLEFVDRTDKGREIQTAYQLDGQGEAQNPTEAGGTQSSTQVLSLSVLGKVLTTTVSPAYWQPWNGQTISKDTISKKIEVDWNGIKNVIKHDVTITLDQDHQSMAIEGLTGYMTSQFTRLFVAQDGNLTETQYTPSVTYNPTDVVSSADPIILATPDGSHAIGIYSNIGSYAAWMGAGGNTNKWDAALQGITPAKGTYAWTVFYVIGTLDDVQSKLRQLK